MPKREKVYVLHALARKKNKPVMGLVIIKGLKKDGKEYNDGNFRSNNRKTIQMFSST
jgi:hypothetical protein